MEVRAVSKYVKVQPRKVRIIADEVRGMTVVFAAHKLRYHTSKGAEVLRKTLMSAAANAAENHELSIESLKIAEIRVDEGPRQKRMQARAMGRGNQIVKKTAHITVVVADTEAAEAVKPHGTRPKARPTLAVKPGRTPRPSTRAAAPAVAPVADATAAPATDATLDPAIDNAPPEGTLQAASAQETAEQAVAPAEPTVNEAAEADAEEATTDTATPPATAGPTATDASSADAQS